MKILSYCRPRRRLSNQKIIVCATVGAFIVISICVALRPVKSVLHRGIDRVLIWSMRDYDSGGGARTWLDDSFSNEWSVNPFPSACIDSVQGLSDRTNEVDYWLRVKFKPAYAQTIIDNLRDSLRQPKVGSITMTTGPWPPLTSEAAPSFWNPAEVANPVTFKFSRRGADPRILGREVDISISREKGIAYIRFMQF